MEAAKEYWEKKKEFLNKYSEVFLPYLKKQDDNIKKVIKNYNYCKNSEQNCAIFLCLAYILLIGSPFFLFSGNLNTLYSSFIYFFIIFIVLAFAFCNDHYKHKILQMKPAVLALKKQIKDELMPRFCQCFENLRWTCDKYDDVNILNMGEFSKLNKESIKVDDVFSGVNNSIAFDIVEMYAEFGEEANHPEVYGNDGKWDSICIRIKTDKKFSSNTYIVPKKKITNSIRAKIGGFFSGINLLIGKLCGLENEEINKLKNTFHFTDLEDVEFKKKFDVYTDNDLEARYLITPAFMERISDIETKFKANFQRIEFCWGNELLIFIKTREDSFEPFSTDRKISNMDACLKIYDEIISIFNLIDYLKKYLVFDVKIQDTLSRDEVLKLEETYNEAQNAEYAVSEKFEIIDKIAIFSPICFCLILFIMPFIKVKSDYIAIILISCFAVCVVLFILALFGNLLKQQLTRQTDRYRRSRRFNKHK